MCLLAFAWQRSTRHRLWLAGNRDEFHGRAAAPMQWWSAPRLLAGRDLQAGGTWLGVGEDGRFAVVTNFRGGATPSGAPSRGELIPAFLGGGLGALEYLRGLAARGRAYAGFSLLAGDAGSLGYYSNHDPAGPRELGPGVYGLSNGLLDSPWPKVVRTRETLAQLVAAAPDEPPVESLFDLMRDGTVAPDEQLPDTGVGRAIERRLSPAFIVGPDYGTRCTTVLAIRADGSFVAAERSFDPDGRATTERSFESMAETA
ncbi:MAG: NRDE family protein [Pseudomonadota bacterium]